MMIITHGTFHGAEEVRMLQVSTGHMRSSDQAALQAGAHQSEGFASAHPGGWTLDLHLPRAGVQLSTELRYLMRKARKAGYDKLRLDQDAPCIIGRRFPIVFTG